MKLAFLLFFALSVASTYGRYKTVDRKWLKSALTNDIPKVPLYQGNAIEGRLVGGEEIVPHSHPYLVAMIISTPRGDIVCHGSLLNEETVMSSAICLHEAISVEVVAGAHAILDNEPSQQRVTVNVAGIHIHPSFISNWRAFDIATIWLPIRLVFNEFVGAVTLPYEHELLLDSFAGEQCKVISWGSLSGVPHSVEQVVITNTNCLIQVGNIGPNNICLATLGGRGPCSGDIGAPLTLVRTGITYQVGIFSFVQSSDCMAELPAAFSRVTSHINWLELNTQCSICEPTPVPPPEPTPDPDMPTPDPDSLGSF